MIFSASGANPLDRLGAGGRGELRQLVQRLPAPLHLGLGAYEPDQYHALGHQTFLRAFATRSMPSSSLSSASVSENRT
jgi:hypothetical protein